MATTTWSKYLTYPTTTTTKSGPISPLPTATTSPNLTSTLSKVGSFYSTVPSLPAFETGRRLGDPNVNPYQTTTPQTPVSLGPRPTASVPSSASQLFNQYRSLYGAAPRVSDEFAAMQPQSISGLGEDYFNSQRDMLKERLRQDFFGPLGTLQQTASQESAAGRLGSGVGQQIISDAAITPYMRSQGELDTQFANLYQQERSRVDEFNAEQMNLYTDRLAQLRTQDQNVAIQLNDLAMQAADAQAGRLSQQAIAQLEADLRVWEAAVEDLQKQREFQLEEQRNAIQYIGTPIDMNKTTQEQIATAQQLNNYFNN